MKRLILILGIVVVFVFSVSASNILAQPGNMCEGDYNRDNNVDGGDVGKFLEDFGRSLYNNPCPETYDYPPMWSKYERMSCEMSPDCWMAGYEYTPMFTDMVCCCWDQTGTYNYGCRGETYCQFDLMGYCF